MNIILCFYYQIIVTGLIVKQDSMCTKCCHLRTYFEISVQRQYFLSSLVLTALQQEWLIQKWSTELAVYCLGQNQKQVFYLILGHLAWKRNVKLGLLIIMVFLLMPPSLTKNIHYYYYYHIFISKIEPYKVDTLYVDFLKMYSGCDLEP